MHTQPPKLLDKVRHVLRTKHYARSTEEAYLYWIKRFIFFHNKRHPQQMNTGSGAQPYGILRPR